MFHLRKVGVQSEGDKDDLQCDEGKGTACSGHDMVDTEDERFHEDQVFKL